MKAQRIEGAVALVTGAGRGIGRALTEALLTRRVKKVYATARDPEALRALRDERLVPLRLDVTDVDQIRAAGEAASDVELVFSNAGVAFPGGIREPTFLDQARREMEVAGLTNVPFIPTYGASKAALHSLTQAARILLGAQGTSVFGAYPGPEDIYPDPFAVDFSRLFGASPKAAERQIAAMMASMPSGSAA